MILNKSSLAKLRGVHPHLLRVVNRCAADWRDKTFTWVITCGPRTIEEQRILVRKGASKTMRSRHIPAKNGFSHAVDVGAIISGQYRGDWNLYIKIANAMRAAALAENVPVEWGGTWASLNTAKGPVTAAVLHKTFPDGPHFQLPWASYPGSRP